MSALQPNVEFQSTDYKSHPAVGTGGRRSKEYLVNSKTHRSQTGHGASLARQMSNVRLQVPSPEIGNVTAE